MDRLPLKQRALVEGESIEYVAAGSGPATVVLVNGAGGPIEGWHRIFGAVAVSARVVAYNRPGIGGSSKPVVPQVGSHMVSSLRGMLRAAGLSPPYILVGHSLGGLIVNLFARLYPSDVAAVIFLEATAPQDVFAMRLHENVAQRVLRRILAVIAPPNSNAEIEHVGASVAELESAPPFPPVPLIVITGGKPAMAWATTPAAHAAHAARAAGQVELAKLSPLGKQVTATRSGHFPQFTEPQLVIAALAEVTCG